MSIPNYGVNPLAGRPGYPVGYPAGGVVDADPFTPGIQAQPGVVTATGPTQFVQGGAVGGMLTSGLRQQQAFAAGNVGFGGFSAPVVDADPLTPGIQAQPGVVTATGPARVVQQGVGVAGGFQQVGAIGGGLVDADPLTPGIQAQPGVITATGPSQVVGGAYGGAVGYQQGFQTGGLVDADPLTPGIQSQPGVVTATGPARVVSGGYGGYSQVGAFPQGAYQQGDCCGGYNNAYGYNNSYGYGNQWWQCCPWWVWPLLGLLLVGALIGGLVALFRSRRSDDDDEEVEVDSQSTRNGRTVKRRVTRRTTTTRTDDDAHRHFRRYL